MFFAPVLLSQAHDVADFSCGVASLDEWLKRRALPNQISGASRTYVVVDGVKVVAYYCLSSGALAIAEVPSSVRRNMPDPVPMAIIGRLAVDKAISGRGLGAALLQDAFIRTAQASNILGIRGILVHAISEQAKNFYEKYGFSASPTQPMTLVLSLKKQIVN